MATGPKLKFVLSRLLGENPATIERYLANLADAGLVRRSGRGGGKGGVHLTSSELADVVLGLGALYPYEAADTARVLGGLFPENPQAGDMSLKTFIGFTIERVAIALRHGTPMDFGASDWELVLSRKPPRAWMNWPSRGPGAIRRYFDYIDAKTIASSTSAPTRRHCIALTQPLLIAIAKLYANSEDADSLAGEPAPDASPPRARTEELDSLNSSEPNLHVCVRPTPVLRNPQCTKMRQTTTHENA
jgi:hypothetical protein